ncbi:MAG: chemotaxis protein, partial [Duganella sp.]
MTRKKILGSHVKRLLSGVSDHGRKHLTEVETDLIQTRLLLEEAIDKLSFNFMAIHQAVSAEQKTIQLLLDGGHITAEQRSQLEALPGQ